jgi:hypothetical protein
MRGHPAYPIRPNIPEISASYRQRILRDIRAPSDTTPTRHPRHHPTQLLHAIRATIRATIRHTSKKIVKKP